MLIVYQSLAMTATLRIQHHSMKAATKMTTDQYAQRILQSDG